MFQLSLFKDQMTDFLAIKKHTNVRWPDDIEQRLRVMLTDGLSRSQIAAQLGVSRNAICGKVYRLGLVRPRPPRRTNLAPIPRRQRGDVGDGVAFTIKSKRAHTYRGDGIRDVAPDDNERVGVTLLDLTRSTCRWPLPSGEDAPTMFCGDPAEDTLPYCIHHCRRAFKKPSTRGDKIAHRIKYLNNSRRAAA